MSRRARVRARSDWSGCRNGVLAENAAGELVGVGLSHHAGAGIDKGLHHRRGAPSRRVEREPIRIACPGHVARDVEQILCRKRKPGQRARRRSL